MLSWLKNIDTQLLLFINSHHTAFFDFVMYWASDKLIWIPFYIFLLFVLYKKTGNEVWKILLAVLVLIILTDQFSVLIKNFVLRYRPCHNLLLQTQVRLVNESCGGQYGFVSSHAANTFGFATLLCLIAAKKINWLLPLLFCWACFVSYSRIYLGSHYPADVFGGWVLGFLSAQIIFYFYKIFLIKNRKL